MNLHQFRIVDDVEAKELYKLSSTIMTASLVVGGVVMMVCLSPGINMGSYELNDADFYPQVVYVQQILPKQNVLFLEDIRLRWQKDLEEIRLLQDNWDDEGASAPNEMALNNMEDFVESLDSEMARRIVLYPNALGAITMKMETPKGRIKCEMGDVLMSYFIKRQKAPNEYHSFEPIDVDHLEILKKNLSLLV